MASSARRRDRDAGVASPRLILISGGLLFALVATAGLAAAFGGHSSSGPSAPAFASVATDSDGPIAAVSVTPVPSTSAPAFVQAPASSVPPAPATTPAVTPPPATTRPPATTTRASTHAPAPSTSHAPPPPPHTTTSAPAGPFVTPGAFCRTPGATGISKTGKLYVCGPSPTDPRNRWRPI